VIGESDPKSRAFRILPWWLRAVLGAAGLLVAVGVPGFALFLVVRPALVIGAPSTVMLGCTLGLFALPVSAVTGRWLWTEVHYALNDPDRPAIQRREQEALDRVLRRHRHSPTLRE
jgi:membrane protein implicated in regulation of membrane protease activity